MLKSVTNKIIFKLSNQFRILSCCWLIRNSNISMSNLNSKDFESFFWSLRNFPVCTVRRGALMEPRRTSGFQNLVGTSVQGGHTLSPCWERVKGGRQNLVGTSPHVPMPTDEHRTKIFRVELTLSCKTH